MKQYKASRDCIKKYTNLSWMKGVEENEKYIIDDFRIFALGNTYTVDLMEGRREVLSDYVQYLKQYRRELVAGMITILEYAIKNDLSIEWVLADLSKELGEIESSPDNSTTARHGILVAEGINVNQWKYSNCSTESRCRLLINLLSICPSGRPKLINLSYAKNLL
ncbi:hypothetical protein PaeBR_23550 [Paenibacillus sp. BR2-3]|uniref:hypothetical protein n=1 Tax=Paenibacillus sp. BR2-3 TaxID=3048494 RepID=UPI00397796E3